MSEATASAARRSWISAEPLAGLAAAGQAVPVALLASLPGLVFVAGFDHLAYGLGLLAGVVLAGLLIAPHVARTGAATITDALRHRFGRATAIIGAIVIVLVVLPLLAAELTFVGVLAEAGLGVPYLVAIFVTLAASVAATLWLGERAFAWLAVAAYGLLAASLFFLLGLLAFKAHGIVLPHIAFGQALTAISGHEGTLLENGLVDFDTFTVHVAPFLRLSGRDFLALVISVALGTAVLPPLVSALAAGRHPHISRMTGAWAALFVMLVLVSVPALAAYVKLAIYGALAGDTPLAALPSWLAPPLKADLAHVHGISLAMLSRAADAVGAGAADPAAIADHLARHALAAEQRWLALDEQVRAAIVAAARTISADASGDALWQAYVGQVLPVAATAAGNEAAMLTQAALVIEPLGLLLALPALSGAPGWIAPLIVIAILAAALVMATALIRSLRALVVDEPAASRSWRAPAVTLATAAVAAGFATLRPDELVTIVVSALSLGAAGLFPVLALGLAWRHATAAGAIAAILAGGGVTLYYDVGIQVFPAAFYRTWAPISNAADFAIEEFATLETDAREAESEEERAAAAAALETLARGTATRHGLANWFGIDSASGAIFGVPVGLLALVLVSLLSRFRPSRDKEP
ncbi:hypothetical protein [Hyphomicrobium sp.]|uniref:sodium:solute symporter family transporter n=1 Tax=Hyphomicrobium sp. TaxID=82 RepID=UPI0025C03C0A|nr:hypothetical protein [Hyphomicrobium sp.]MCC7250697.1 hypothetical protein [Hyphomicrobium sp.]